MKELNVSVQKPVQTGSLPHSFTLKMSFLIQGLWDRKSSMEKPGFGLTADMATQYPPLELGRILSGNPGRLSMKFSIPPLFRPATWTLTEKDLIKMGKRWDNFSSILKGGGAMTGHWKHKEVLQPTTRRQRHPPQK